MSVLGGKSTFMIKILVRAREYRSTTNFSKIPLLAGLKVKSVFSAYFSIESSNLKKITFGWVLAVL
jgi:hypothetical protein